MPKKPGDGGGRYKKNDIIRVIETEYTPISPATRTPEFDSPGMPLTLWQKQILGRVFTPVPCPDEPGPLCTRCPMRRHERHRTAREP